MITATEKLRLKVERPFVVFFYRVFSKWTGGFRILLLTTTGHKSKRIRTVPLVYMPIEDSVVVVAANLGSDNHPRWYLNLKQDPLAQIQIGSSKLFVVAEDMSNDKREQVWTEWIKVNPGYQGFQSRTARKLPIVVLKPAKPLF